MIDCNAPVEFDEKTFAVSEPNREKLAGLFKELGFTRLLSQLDIKPSEAKTEKAKPKAVEPPVTGGGQGMLFAVGAETTAKEQIKTIILSIRLKNLTSFIMICRNRLLLP